jgi:hypothetical protein
MGVNVLNRFDALVVDWRVAPNKLTEPFQTNFISKCRKRRLHEGSSPARK